jgi:hypothetical protein
MQSRPQLHRFIVTAATVAMKHLLIIQDGRRGVTFKRQRNSLGFPSARAWKSVHRGLRMIPA